MDLVAYALAQNYVDKAIAARSGAVGYSPKATVTKTADGAETMKYYELLNASKGLPVTDYRTMLFARKLLGKPEKIATATGYPCVLENSVGKPAISYKIYGNTIQNGTPVPENPVEVQGVGKLITGGEYSGKYVIPVVCRGKNLFDISTVVKGYRIIWATGALYKDKNAEISDYIPVQKASSYYVNYPVYVAAYDKNKVFIGTFFKGIWIKGSVNRTTNNFLTPENCGFIKIFTFSSVGSIFQKDTQLEYGTIATKYEPYHEPITTSIYINELLYTGEYIIKDKSGGKVHRAWGVKFFDGTEKWLKGTYPPNNAYQFYTYLWPELKSGATIEEILNTHFINQRSENGTAIGAYYNLYPKVSLFPENPSVDDLKSFLASEYAKGTPVTVYYPLAEPTEETIDLPDIPLEVEYNLINVDADINPEKMSITYKADRVAT